MDERPRPDSAGPAQAIHDRIVALARAHDYRRLLDMAADPEVSDMLDRLPESTRKRSQLHLQRAVRWREQRMEANLRRMNEARRALDGLDLQLARGVLARVEDEFLDAEGTEIRDALLLEVAARDLEFEELEVVAGELDRDRPGLRPRRRWWRRPR